MTAFTVTMSASVVMFGAAQTDKWGAYNWNAFKWGEGTAPLGKNVRMAVNTTNLSLASTAAVNFRFVHLLAGETLTSTAAVNFRFGRLISETITPSGTVQHLYVQDHNNFYRVFPEQVTDLTLRSTPTWTAGSASAVTWTTAAAATTTWS